MKQFILFLALIALLPVAVNAACNPMIALPCVDDEMARIDRRMDSYGQNSAMSEPMTIPPVGSLTDKHLGGFRVPDPLTRPANQPDWTYYQTPNGKTYTNFGYGLIVGPDGGLYAPY